MSGSATSGESVSGILVPRTGRIISLGWGCAKANCPCQCSPSYTRGTLAYEKWERANLKPVAPVAADVLYSLLSDATADQQSFNDWCADLGCNADSIKALNTYSACCEISKNLRRIFTAAQIVVMRE